MIRSIVLSDPDLGISSVILPRPGIAHQGYQFAPLVRATGDARVASHGQVNRTYWLDAGAFSLNLHLYPPPDGSNTPAGLVDELGAYCRPAGRPVITYTRDEWAASGPRQLSLVYDSGFAPVVLGQGVRRDLQLSWVVPDGCWEAATPVSATVAAYETAPGTGWQFTPSGLQFTTAGVSMAASDVASASLVNNTGALECDWTALLFGPCTGPKLANDTTGQAVEFTDQLVLPTSSDYVTIDSDRNCYLGGDKTALAGGFLSFATTDWWDLQPGINQIRYYPTSSSAAGATLTFRPAWALG